MANDQFPAQMPIRMHADDGTPVGSMWCYNPRDPWTVSVRFGCPTLCGRCDEALWIFARDLIVTGLHEPAGMGDVQLWPEYDLLNRVVAVQLSSPTGDVVLTAYAADVEAFLALTYGWVPEGDEPPYLDVDAAVARVLEEESC